MKKIWISLMTLCLSGCGLLSNDPSPIPAEFAGADYELSDIDAQKWVQSSKQVEQCVYPNLTRIQQEHFKQEDNYIYSQYVFFYPLEEIIGEENVKIVQNDEKSMNYATYQFKKFKLKQVAEPLEAKACKVLQTKAREDLAVVKGQYVTGMVEEAKADGKTTVASDENKFFFDIIKWGSALLL